jgi:hypothetical protein
VSRHRSFTTAIAVLFLAAPLAAQSVSQNAAVQSAVLVTAQVPVAAPSPVAERAPSLGPTQANATVGVRASATPAAPLPSPAPEGSSRSPAMMIVGGAALIVGAIVGGTAGTIVMVVGGVIGLVGLWNYLQ